MKLDLASSDPFVSGVLHAAAAAAAERSADVYLVGGPIRDSLLGLSYTDIDLMSTDAADDIARAIAQATGGRIRSYPQFLTFKVVVPGHPAVDVTTARSETYRKPGALPLVERGSVRDDLFRRDYTVNAMALDLHRGELIDPFDGQKDLADRVLRTLHDRSFIDDPTRIFRGIRIGARLGFDFEAQTFALMNEGRQAGLLDTISRERLWREFFLALDEPDAASAICALADAGVLEVLTGTKGCSEALRARLGRLTAWRRSHAHDFRTAIVAALATEQQVDERLAGSGFSSAQRANIARIAAQRGEWEAALNATGSSREHFRILRELTPEGVAILASAGGSAESAASAYEASRGIRLPFRGGDLGVPPGPHIARAIEETREAIFFREVEPSQARTFARGLALRYLKQ